MTEALSLSIAYSHGVSEVVEDTIIPIGTRGSSSPEQQGNIWARYDFGAGPLTGFGIGVGVVYRDEGAIYPLETPTFVDGFTRFDASLYYDGIDNLSLQLDFRNLTDERYLESYRNQNYGAKFGQPFGIVARARYRFS